MIFFSSLKERYGFRKNNSAIICKFIPVNKNSMKKQWLIGVMIFQVLILCISCNISSTYNNRVEDKDDALKVANAFFMTWLKTRITTIYILYTAKDF